MAQSSNAAKEPTTDEILASIREIIEENTGHVTPRVTAKNQSEIRSGAHNDSAPATAQIRPEANTDSLNVDDAMKALAARIGLSEQANRNEFNSNAGQPVNNNMEAVADSTTQPVTTDVPTGQQERVGFETARPVEEATGTFQNALSPNTLSQDSLSQDASPRDSSMAGVYQPAGSEDFSAREEVENAPEREPQPVTQGKEIYADMQFSPKFWESVDSLAEQALRPVLVKWLQKRWPALVEKILREEITTAFEKNFPSDRG